MTTDFVFDPAMIKRARRPLAKRILFRYDCDTETPAYALSRVDDRDFVCWYVPLWYQAFYDICLSDYVEDGLREDDTPTGEEPPTREDWRDQAIEEIDTYECLGYQAMLGPVLLAMEIGGGGLGGWGTGHGVGRAIIRFLQQKYPGGLLAMNVTGGQRMLLGCGFRIITDPPPGVIAHEYEHRPYMAWKLDDAAAAALVKKYRLGD